MTDQHHEALQEPADTLNVPQPGEEGAAGAPGGLPEGIPSPGLADPDITVGSSEAGPPLAASLEAILMVVDEPAAEVMLAQVLQRPTDDVRAALLVLAADYDASERGFELREVAGGWRFYTRAACADVVERFVLDGQQARLTQAALETLAVVAYRQPVSRARVSAVRGVNVDGVMRTLVTRGLVEESGTETDSGSILYRTTSYFLERLGLTSLEDLPELAPYLPEIESLDSESFLASS
jgi:segregation and condensation protein B